MLAPFIDIQIIVLCRTQHHNPFCEYNRLQAAVNLLFCDILDAMAYGAEFNPVRAAEMKFGPENERDEVPLQEIEMEMRELRKLERAADGAVEETVSRAKEKWGNIPLSQDGRIDFTDEFFTPNDERRRSSWERDKTRIALWKKRWDAENDALAHVVNNEIEQKAYDSSGNAVQDARYSTKAARAYGRYESLRMAYAFEKYKTHVLGKFLGDEFIVMRASLHDDAVNGIDNVIVNAASGDMVCAFDEVASEKEETISAKRDKVEKKNVDSSRTLSGGIVEYAVTIRNGKAEKASVPNVPIFYLYMGKDKLKESLRGIGDLRVEREALEEMFKEIQAQAVQFDKFPQKSAGFAERVNQFIAGFMRARQKL